MDKDISFRRLKAVIKSKGLSLAEVAEKCGKKATEISNICNDRRVPKTDFLAKICSVKDLFDGIEPPRRLNGQTSERKDIIKKAVAAKYGEGYVSERKNRTDYSKGLPAITRTKLRNDRPINLQLIYEICKKLGCTIDFVMSYK